MAAARRPARLRLRPDRVRRDRGGVPRRPRPRSTPDQDGTLRADMSERGGRAMDALDGNAIAGSLYEIFGAEMTDAGCVCAHCGAERRVAELTVYMRGPGIVVRCRSCEAVVMALVEIR